MTTFIFSEHAIQRYMKRHDRSLAYDAAKALLYREVVHAVDLHKRSPKNDADEWLIPSLDIRILVKNDERLDATEAPRKVVLTILPRRAPKAPDLEMIEAIHQEAVAVFEKIRAEKLKAGAAATSAHTEYGLAKAAKVPKEVLSARTNDLISRQKAAETAKLRLQIARLEMEEAKLLLAMVRADELTNRHVATQAFTAKIHRRVLRVAIKALQQHGIHDALAEIEQIEPAFVTERFLNYTPPEES